MKQIQGFMICRGLDKDGRLLSNFINSGRSLYAYSVFNAIPFPPHIFLFNSIIKHLSRSHPHSSLLLFNSIQSFSLRPDSYSFQFAIDSVIGIRTGLQFHSQTIRFGCSSDAHVSNSLIRMYSSFHYISCARKLFNEVSLSIFDAGLWNSMLSAYAKLGDMDNALHLFDNMPEPNLISWTALMSGYARFNRPHHAIALFQRMHTLSVRPDEVTMLAVLSACAQLGALQLGEWVHNYCIQNRLLRANYIPLSNALIDMYAKCGDVKRAMLVFESMKHRTVVTWTTMIAGLAHHGLAKEALDIFYLMEMARVRPNEVTFIAIFSACCHAGLVQMGHFFFSIMTSRYQIQPRIEHYGCMIDLLGRAGCLQDAQLLLLQMPFQPNAVIWGSLLSASYSHSDPMVGEIALQHLIMLEPNNSGNYALLSNLYASLGRWKESRIVRKMMRDKDIKKMTGGSFIEVNNEINEFISGEPYHPQSMEIYHVLCKLNEQLRLSVVLQNEYAELLDSA